VAIILAVVLGPVTAAAQGWYLFTPPSIERADGTREVTAYVALTRWTQVLAFDTAAACEAHRSRVHSIEMDRFIERRRQGGKFPGDDAMTEAYRYARCIASDDVRLKP